MTTITTSPERSAEVLCPPWCTDNHNDLIYVEDAVHFAALCGFGARGDDGRSIFELELDLVSDGRADGTPEPLKLTVTVTAYGPRSGNIHSVGAYDGLITELEQAAERLKENRALFVAERAEAD